MNTNIQVTTTAAISVGGNAPGGTTGILFVNSVTNGLALIMPDGTVRQGTSDSALGIVFLP